jgi:hypothetical protein
MAKPKVFLTIAVALSACVLSAGAMAQEREGRAAGPAIQDRAVAQPPARLAETTGSGVAAPVGHRQPTLKDLPESARDVSRPAIDPLGPLPKICNQC